MGLSVDEVIRFIYETNKGGPLPHYWWETDFFETHGFSLSELKKGIERRGVTWTYRAASGINYRFYRIEDGEDALRESLAPYAKFASNPEEFPGKIENWNGSRQKPYYQLYEAVKKKIDLEIIRSFRSPLLREIDGLFYEEQ
jgi:hypothetical protein